MSNLKRIIPKERFLVPDLSPRDREFLKNTRPLYVFVAESPHINEIEPEVREARRPLCGAAGRKWWGLLTELLDGETNEEVSREHLLEFCKKNRIAVLNAVQYPLDPKVTKQFPLADPVQNLGFSKVSAQQGFKKMKASPEVAAALQSLRERLTHPSLADASIHCLGNDSDWFVSQALQDSPMVDRVGVKIPHPSAWWRRGGYFGELAQERLSEILQRIHSHSNNASRPISTVVASRS